MMKFYMVGMTILIGLMIYCGFRAGHSELRQRKSIIRLLSVAVVAMLCNLLYVLAGSAQVAYIGFALFSICIDWLLYALLLFVLEYTGESTERIPVLKLYFLLVLVDNISVLLFSVLRRIGKIEQRNIWGYEVWEAGSFGVPYRLHLLGCYLIVIHILVILIRKTLSSSDYYSHRYKSIIGVLVATVVLDAISVSLHMGMNSSILFYGIMAVVICYQSIKFIPGKLISDMQKLMMDRLDSGIICFNEIGECIYANEKVWEIFGEGKNIRRAEEIYYSDRSEQKIFDADDKRWHETRVVNGEERYIEINSHRMLDKNHHFVGFYYSITDRTKEKQAYEELINQEKAANRAKSLFLSQVSHEIRTPVNSIYGMNEMILRESREADVLAYATQIQNATDTLIGIINDILDFSKIEAGYMEMVSREYEPAQLIRNVCDMTMVKAREKGLDFRLEISKDVPAKLLGDDVRISQILMNLLSNAVKYTREGFVSLKIKWTGEQEGLLGITVEDSGIGIKEEDIPNLFSAFSRMDEVRNHSIQGTGLGLSIAKYMVERMGSELKVDSVYGRGSTFSCEIPQTVVDGTPAEIDAVQTKPMSDKTYVPAFQAPWAKILVVDDNRINRMVFRHLLKSTKIQITEAESGSECLELIAWEHFDIIFMDHMMPEMDGVETFSRMRITEHRCKEVPVIMLTANAMEGAMQEYLDMGFADFLPKPVYPEALEETIWKYIKDKRRNPFDDTPTGE